MKGETKSDKDLNSSRVSEEIYKNIFEHSPVGIAIHQEWKVLFINPAMVQMLGYESVDEIAGRSILEFVHPDYREQAEKNAQMVLSRKGKSGDLHEMKLIRKDGSHLDVTAVAQFIIYNGKPAIQAYLLNITERKRVQEALRETEEFSRAVIEHSPLGVSVRSYNGQLLSVNEVWKKIWAVPEAELLEDYRKKRSVLEFDETDTYLKEFLADVKRVYQRGGYLHIPELEIENPRKGAARWVSQYFYAINDEEGKVDRVVILTEDITERKQAEERYRTFTEEALVGIYIYSNSKKKYLFVNPEMAKITGYSREELLEINPNRLAVPEDLSILAEREKKLFEGKPIDPEYVIRIRRNDGSIAVLSVRTHRILYAGEEVALGNCIDISERKRAERALKRRVKTSGVLAALTRDLYTAGSVQQVLDVTIKHLSEVFPFYVSVNLIEEKGGKRFLPVKAYHIESKILSFAEKLIGRKFMSWPIPLYQDSVISRTMSTGHPTVIGLDFEPDEPVVQTDVKTMLEAMLERKSPLRPVARLIAERTGEKSLLGIPFSNASGEIIGSLTVLADFRFSRDDYNLAKVASDIIGRTLGQLFLTEELQESEERYRTLQDNVPVGIFRTTPEGNLLSANPAMLKMLGYASMQEFKPISVEEVYVITERRAEFRRILEQKGSIADFEVQLRRKDGSFFWASLNASAIKDEAGNAIYYDGIMVDIAERKRGGELRQVRVQLLDMLREVETIEDCLQLACAAVRDARLFKRAVFTTKNEKGETTHFAQVGVDSQLVEELSKSPPAAKEVLEQMFRPEFKISHSYFIPVEVGVDIEQTGRYVLQEEESGKGPEAWQQGDELLVPMLGMGGLIKSWLSVDTPFDRKRPDRTTVIYLEDIVDIVARQIREIENVNALRESEERYRTFSEEALVGVYIFGGEGRFLYVNPVMEEIFGYTQEELLNMNPWDMVLQEDLEGPLKARGEAQVRGEEVPPSYQMRIRRKNGETAILEIKAHEIVYQGSPATLGNCINITERKRAEQALEREHRAFRIIVQAAVHGKDIADLCFQVIEGLAGALDFDAGTVRLYDANKNLLELTASFGLSETEQVAAAASQPLNDTAYIAAFTAQTQKPIIAPDVTREQVLKPFASRLKKFGECSLISWPLLDAREELLGVLHLWSRKTIHISEDDKSFFERITVMFSNVLERKLAEEERDRGRRELQALCILFRYLTLMGGYAGSLVQVWILLIGNGTKKPSRCVRIQSRVDFSTKRASPFVLRFWLKP
jgi:PAS domain S-box-containing protein